jgi:two-component system sensor histidine kinase YesM
MKKASMKGIIRIRSFGADGILKIIVEDDGYGMSDLQIDSLLITSASNEHYGVKNIDGRIKLYYGQEYGLQYESKIGKGTTVTISLPIRM